MNEREQTAPHESAREELLFVFDPVCPQSYLALGPCEELAREQNLDLRYIACAMGLSSTSPPPAGDDRTSRHLQHRETYLELDLRRGAEAQGLTLQQPLRRGGSELAGAVFAALDQKLERTGDANALRSRFLAQVFAGVFENRLDAGSPTDLQRTVKDLGLDWDALDLDAGRRQLEADAQRLRELRVASAPALVFRGEVFQGRAHFELLRSRVAGETTPI